MNKKIQDYWGVIIQGSIGLVSGGIKPSIKKIKAVTDWEILKNVRYVQSFLGFSFFFEGLLETIPLLLSLYIR